MQRDLILHIGLSKTGSSSIQRVLAGQRDALRTQGVYIPTSPGWANHALLPASLVNNPKILWGFHPGTWEGMTPAARIDRFRDEWTAEIAGLPDWATRCLITAEQIGGLLRGQDEVDRLAALLRPIFSSVQVVVYIRRQDLHAASAYTQWLRGGVMVDPGLPEGGPDEHPEYDYGNLLGRYANAFGESAVCPRIFDRASLHKGDVVEDFLHITSVDLQIPPETGKKNSNPSMTLEGQHLLLAAGRRLAARAGDSLWRDTPQWRRLAESVGEAMPGRGWRPTRAEAAAFMERFAATNEQARARFLPHLLTLFPLEFADLPAEPELASDDTLAGAAIDVLLHEIANSAQREAQAAMGQYRVLKRVNDRPAMRQALVRALKFGPDLLPARLRAADFFLEEGDLRQAREHAAVARNLAPGDPQVAALLRRVERGVTSPSAAAAPTE
jgi:hypothetical protein